MKKQFISFLAIGALLMQSSGVYSMDTARRAWEGSRVQQAWQRAGSWVSSVSPGVSREELGNFLSMAGKKASEGWGSLMSYLEEHKKVAKGVVLAIIIVLLSLWKVKGKPSPQKPISLEQALKSYSITEAKAMLFLEAVVSADDSWLLDFYDKYEESPETHKYLLKKNLLQAAQALIGAEPSERDRLASNIIAYFKAMSDNIPQDDHQVQSYKANIEQMRPEATEMTTFSEI